MKVSRLKEILKDYNDEDYVFVILFTKVDADEYIEWLDEESETELTAEQWGEVVDSFDRDDAISTEINNSWSYHMDKQLIKRKGNNGNNK